MHWPNTKTFLASSAIAAGSVMSSSRRSSFDTPVTNAFLATIVGMSANIASHSWGSIPSEEIMYSSESAWMFSSWAWRPRTSLSSDAVTSSRTTWMMLSPTIPSAAEK